MDKAFFNTRTSIYAQHVDEMEDRNATFCSLNLAENVFQMTVCSYTLEIKRLEIRNWDFQKRGKLYEFIGIVSSW
jgi:hypothetical protein